jgi:phosphohistidine phosphatase
LKTLFIIRHAKSSWSADVLNDFDRPLNQRGHTDAPTMAQRLVAQKFPIDAFVSSTANRAFTTATYFAKAYQQTTESIIQVPALYHAPPVVFFETIHTISNQYQHIAIFAHNPGITQFVNQLTQITINNMPTCSIFAISTSIKNWKEFGTQQNEWLFFDYPKNPA